MRIRLSTDVKMLAAIVMVSGELLTVAGGDARLVAQERGATFDVVSVKPYKSANPGRGGDLRDPQFLPGGRFTSRAPLIMVIGAAYDVPAVGPLARISGGPAWISSLDVVYDIQAAAPPARTTSPLSAGEEAGRLRQMLRNLLADRFRLAVRRQAKDTPVYVLTVAKGGPKLLRADVQEKACPPAPLSNESADGEKVCHRFNGGRGRGAHARAADMSDFANFVGRWADRPILNETGITGLYRIDTESWLPMNGPASQASVDGTDITSLPTLFAVVERLGLKLVPQSRKQDAYVIEHVERAAEN